MNPMGSHETPRRTHEQISIQQVGAETLLYDERRHMAFCLNRTSSLIWRLADGGHTIAQISAAVSLELKTAESEELVLFALDELRRDGLIEPCGRPDAAEPISRRALLQRLGVGGAMLLPVVSAIVAPTAAQAYSGCFDCSVSPATRARAGQARARSQQLNSSPNGNNGLLSPFAEPETLPGTPPE
jgi:coenzyme PQQ synthesis protein D (PqqD)